MNALGRMRYEPHISELIEFSSFFAAALVSSQDGFLRSKFSKREAERAKGFFVKEGEREKAVVMEECFGVGLKLIEEDGGRIQYSMPFESYLRLVTKHELTKSPKWKLVRQALSGGTVFLSDNLVNDLFGDCAQGAVSEGVKNLRRATFPKQLLDVKAAVMQYVPVQESGTKRGYRYIETLLEHPISDGRHRIVWLILSGYATNLKKLSDEEAIEMIRNYVRVGGETSEMRRFIEYNVRRARRTGLMPPTLFTLKTEHPDLYGLLPKEVLVAEAQGKPRMPKKGVP